MINFTFLLPNMTNEHLGFIPYFMDENIPTDARHQINANYQHGGGWHDVKGFGLGNSISAMERHVHPSKLVKYLVLQYPGDPPLHPIAFATLRDETIVVYPHAFVAIFQPDYSYEVSRID